MQNLIFRGVGIGLGVAAGIALWPLALLGIAAALVAQAFKTSPEDQPLLPPASLPSQLTEVRREAMAKVEARNLQSSYLARLERLEKAWASSGDYPQTST